MDIKDLTYFIEIVKNNFNLTATAKKLFISQPNLSQKIKQLEETENVLLFLREKGRLVGLTEVGKNFYANATLVLNSYDNLINDLKIDSNSKRGKVKIGIPPLILGIPLAEVIVKIITENPEIELEIIEKGAFELQKMLILKELDFAILLAPLEFTDNVAFKDTLINSELVAFVHKNNPLLKKKKLIWEDLAQQYLSTFNEDFMIHHKIKNFLHKYNVTYKKVIYSGCWDFLFSTVKHKNFLTILPKDIYSFCSNSNIKMIPFKDPVKWEVILCTTNKEKYSNAELFVKDEILKYFELKNNE